MIYINKFIDGALKSGHICENSAKMTFFRKKFITPPFFNIKG